MSKRRKNNSSFWLKLISALLLLLSFLGLLGAFGLSIGKPVDAFFTIIMGGLAWAGPFLSFVTGLLLWIYATTIIPQSSVSSKKLTRDEPKIIKNHGQKRQDQKNRDRRQDSELMPLPAGKIVNLKGFNQYFSSPDWVEVKDKDDQITNVLKEVGRDFPSYFGKGESVLATKRPNLTILKGLNEYFKEVDQEESLDDVSFSENKSINEDKISQPSIVEPARFSSVFKSKSEQEEFLAQFKDNDNYLNEDDLDTLLDVQEDVSWTNSDSKGTSNLIEDEEIPQTFACLMPKNETITAIDTEPDTWPGITFEEPSEEIREQEWKDSPMDVLQETACTSERDLDLDPVVEKPDLKPNHSDQEAEVSGQKAEADRHWEFPDFNVLDPLPQRTIIQDTETSQQLEKVLLDFGVKAKLIRVTRGPVITRYELAPAPGVKISKIVNLSDDIALALAARDVRIEAPIPGKAAIGIEVPNKQALSVPFREVLETSSFGQYPSKLKVALGKDISDQPIIADLIKMPHLLVAGATGSGKSVCITTIINSLLFNATPDEVKLLLVDPKMVELSQYNGIPHLLAPVVIDPKKAASALKWIVKEMENRYELFAASGVRDIERYNRLKAAETSRNTPALPFVVVIIDELADLMMVAAGEVEEAICRLAQMARAAGIHLVIATQRPSVDVITGVIKANIPSRISFAVSSQIDSRTILDATGAEKLIGRGDMLYSPLGVNKALRVQGCLVTDDEVQRVIMHWKGMGKPEYLDPERLFSETTVKSDDTNGPDDALFLDAGHLFIRTGMASVSFLQRRLKLGYTRAARLMDMLEEQGVVGAYEGSKPRQVLLTLDEFDERFG